MTRLLPHRPDAAADLATFARRVARFDAEAVIRVVAVGRVAGFFADTPFDALALRAVALSVPTSLDVVVEAGTLAARAVGAQGELELPPPVPALRWTSSLPPRSGWSELSTLPGSKVAAVVASGVDEFRRRSPEVTAGLARREGRAALERLAADIWNRELVAGVPIRLAHAADSYGFLAPDDVVLRSAGPWLRLDAPHGSILARTGLPLFA
ncbi:MAG: hypothetical protein ICV70_07320 [Jiangellaceae bacterium]|nr:hypothetical protein [Jiangellaceae bacterium]